MLLTVETPPTASISINSGSTTPSTSLTANTGVIGPLQAAFDLSTNGTDDDFDFVITSSITYDGGSASAYDSNGNILFVNTAANSIPTATDVSNAKNGIRPNHNVISYPVTMILDSPFISTFHTNYKTYGNSYVINVRDGTEGKVIHSIGSNPVENTYSPTGDAAGTYRATITMSAIAL